MRNKKRRELKAILRSASRGNPEELDALVVDLKSEVAGPLRWRASRRRAAAVDRALADITAAKSSAGWLAALATRTKTITRHTVEALDDRVPDENIPCATPTAADPDCGGG